MMKVVTRMKVDVTKDGRLYIPKLFLENLELKGGDECYIEEVEIDGMKIIAISKEGFVIERLNEILKKEG